MKGFKVVREDHIHHGFKYQEGLNVDTNPFRAEGSCVAGGLYFFTDIKDVAKWLDYGVYLYEVEVPNGRRYVKDPDGDKYRSKYLLLKNRFDLREVSTWKYIIQQGVDIHALPYALPYAARNGYLDLVKYLVQNGADIHADNDDALRFAAEYGHLDIVKYLVKKGADIHARDDVALRWSAQKGYLDVVEYLVKKGANIHAQGDYALRWSAHNGHLDVVKYLVEKGANIHARDGYALCWAENNRHSDVVEYLKSVGAVYEGF